MTHHVQQLRRIASGGPLESFEPYFAARNIDRHVITDPSLKCDGYLTPLGSDYGSGFKMFVKQTTSTSRARFTISHEICHTFFYQLVPELKFIPHDVDDAEERLCNAGAAELLMPSEDLRIQPEAAFPSFTSLENLAAHYKVSLEAMALRLRALGLWQCEISVWHQKSSGAFVLERFHGKDRQDWRWTSDSDLQLAWDRKRGQVLSGTTFVHCRNAKNMTYTKRVNYQVKRCGENIFALWSPRAFSMALPLFAKKTARKKIIKESPPAPSPPSAPAPPAGHTAP